MTPPTPADPQGKTAEMLFKEVKGRLLLLQASRPSSLDGWALSPISKIPFKALWYRESLLWRIVQLGQSAFENFESNRLASAILLTRATTETSAALWYLSAKIKAAVESQALGDVDEYLMRLLMGSRTDTDIMPQAINVLTFIDSVEKDIPGFREQYDRLSEFAHPNWAGTTLLFSKVDEPKAMAHFGESVRGGVSTKTMGAVNLSVALAVFETTYNQITDLMHTFVSVCEQRSNGKGAPKP